MILIEVEMFMTPDEVYERLTHAFYQFNACHETIVLPKVIARELMDDDIFYFIDKALRDAYYQKAFFCLLQSALIDHSACSLYLLRPKTLDTLNFVLKSFNRIKEVRGLQM